MRSMAPNGNWVAMNGNGHEAPMTPDGYPMNFVGPNERALFDASPLARLLRTGYPQTLKFSSAVGSF